MDQQRLKKRRPSQPYPELEDESWQPPAGEDADPVRTAMQGERTRVLNAALGSITPDQRQAIVLFDVEGYDYAEIADLTGVSLGTVKSRIHRGRLALRDRLEGSIGLFRGRGRLMPHPPASHADHDPLAIAAYAAGDATGAELDDALALVAACPDCAALHHDLRAIAAAVPALPAPARTRDFRLTPAQAASLRPAGWRRLLAPFAGPRFSFAGPLGAGLATLGLAGFLVAGSFGVPLAATAPNDGGAAAASGAATRQRRAHERQRRCGAVRGRVAGCRRDAGRGRSGQRAPSGAAPADASHGRAARGCGPRRWSACG